jgi:DNA mismatch endonuclease (patch repair protein)
LLGKVGIVVDALTPERRSANMRAITAKHTSPELCVRRLVHHLGFRYRLHVPTLPGKPDLVFHRLKKIIEVRGCFWHQHHGCIDKHIPKSRLEYWKPKLARNCRRDTENARALRRQGWRILVVWECQAKDAARLTARVQRFLDPH